MGEHNNTLFLLDFNHSLRVAARRSGRGQVFHEDLVSRPRHFKPSVRISRTGHTCTLPHQELCDLSSRRRFLKWPPYPVVSIETQFFIQPLPTPPLPAEAMTHSSPCQVSPNLLFHPVADSCQGTGSFTKLGDGNFYDPVPKFVGV